MTIYKRIPYYVRRMNKTETETKKVAKIWFMILSLMKSKYIKLSPNVLMTKNYKPKK